MKHNPIAYNMAQAVASCAVCWMGFECMVLTNGSTGVGWAIWGILFIWYT